MLHWAEGGGNFRCLHPGFWGDHLQEQSCGFPLVHFGCHTGHQQGKGKTDPQLHLPNATHPLFERFKSTAMPPCTVTLAGQQCCERFGHYCAHLVSPEARSFSLGVWAMTITQHFLRASVRCCTIVITMTCPWYEPQEILWRPQRFPLGNFISEKDPAVLLLSQAQNPNRITENINSKSVAGVTALEWSSGEVRPKSFSLLFPLVASQY